MEFGYDLERYMRPLWNGGRVDNETVMFVGREDTPALTYPASEILSVRSYDLKTEYREGVDYRLENGRVVLTAETTIPYMEESAYYTDDEQYQMLVTVGNRLQGKYTYWGERTTITKWQVAVTYRTAAAWPWSVPVCQRERYARLLEKLEKGEDVTFLFYGDSITAGANASSAVGVEPYAPTWPQMFTQYVAKAYGYRVRYVSEGVAQGFAGGEETVFGTRGTITYVNTAVGGWNVAHGNEHAAEHLTAFVEKYGCDLFVVAFGMNDGHITAEQERAGEEALIGCMREQAADTAVVIVAPMLPNPQAINGWFAAQATFEPELAAAADALQEGGVPCALCPMTSMSRALLTRKRFLDCTGNNINHPNDFLGRLYAQTLFETVVGYDSLAE